MRKTVVKKLSKNLTEYMSRNKHPLTLKGDPMQVHRRMFRMMKRQYMRGAVTNGVPVHKILISKMYKFLKR